MVWARLDDEILDNEKILRAGPLGFALHTAAITWCCRNLTDGIIPRAKVRTLLDLADYADPMEVARLLVDVGLWEEVCEGDELVALRIHDFLVYNPSREYVLAERARVSELRASAGAAGGQRSAETRRSKQTPKQTRSKPEANTQANPEAKPKQKGSPDPDPDPDPQKKSERGRAPVEKVRSPELELPPVVASLDAPPPPWVSGQVGSLAMATGLPEQEIDLPLVWAKYVASRARDRRAPSEPDFRAFACSWFARVKERKSEVRARETQQAAVREVQDKQAARPAPFHAVVAKLPAPSKPVSPADAAKFAEQAKKALGM